MKTNLLITSLSLIATSAYAQSSIPSVGMPSPTVRAEMPREAAPSIPQPAMQRPMPQMNQSGPQSAVSATGGTGGNGGNGGLIMGNGGRGGSGATTVPPPTMYSGVGPLPANDVKASANVGLIPMPPLPADPHLGQSAQGENVTKAGRNIKSPTAPGSTKEPGVTSALAQPTNLSGEAEVSLIVQLNQDIQAALQKAQESAQKTKEDAKVKLENQYDSKNK